MDYKGIAERIIGLKNADLEVRERLIQSGQLGEGYHEEMAAMHNRNAGILEDIIRAIGYPTVDKVGKEASEAAWLVIQHAIGQPDFMKKCAAMLARAVLAKQAEPKNLAYLTDRIAALEGNPQLYGTQFDWDENGQLSPKLFDDLARVNQRRATLGLNTLQEQTEVMRKQAEHEKQVPPVDGEKRKQAFEQWRKTVGWIK